MTAPPQSPPAVIPPLETEQQALALPQVKAIYEAMRLSPERGTGSILNHKMLCEALSAAGVEIGAYDHRIVKWLSQYEAQMCAVVAGFIQRAAQRRDGDEHPARLVLRDDEFTLLSSMLATVRSALADAIAYRKARVDEKCARCEAEYGGLCYEHAGDDVAAITYAALLDELGGMG